MKKHDFSIKISQKHLKLHAETITTTKQNAAYLAGIGAIRA